MSRHITFRHQPVSISYMGFGIGTFILCAFALFMCVNHTRRSWRKVKACYGYDQYNHEPVIQMNPEDNPAYQFGESDQSAYSCDQGPVWKKNILMGGKCQLPDFSGVIMYDSTGNVVPPAKTRPALPALTWK